MKRIRILLFAISLILTLATSAKADLFDRGNGLIYDSDLNITWLQNANYNGFTMSWSDAVNWTDNFVYETFDDWRLPASDISCSGSGCTGSEMGHLFIIDNITSDTPGFFSDVRSYYYWSGTVDESDTSNAWRFNFKSNSGFQGTSSKTLKRYAWAVRDGDSLPAMAPEPASSMLMVAGGLIFVRRRFLKKI